MPNPSAEKLGQAADLFRDFTGREPGSNDIFRIKLPDVGLTVGKCLGVMYEATRDGKTDRYLHEFKKSAQPLIAVSHDGRTFFSVGGRYQFTDAGFVDE